MSPYTLIALGEELQSIGESQLEKTAVAKWRKAFSEGGEATRRLIGAGARPTVRPGGGTGLTMPGAGSLSRRKGGVARAAATRYGSQARRAVGPGDPWKKLPPV